jgi:hypothetical protein
MDLNNIQGDIVELCLNATNQCGTSSLVCQTIDLSDESHYFQGRLRDQFSENLAGIEVITSDAIAVSSSSDGAYEISGLNRGHSFEVHAPIESSYQESDINPADLDFLWQGILEGRNWTETEILAGDLNADGKISIVDALILQRELLEGELVSAGRWLTFTEQCLQAEGREAVANCPGFFDVHLLQASRLNNDFVAIQKADLDVQGNQLNGELTSRYKFEGDPIRHDMNGWKVLALKLTEIPDDFRDVYANAIPLREDEYRIAGGELFILKLMQEEHETVELSFGRNAGINWAESFEVYPNPVVDQFRVAFQSKKAAKGAWTVTDYTGRTVLFSKMNWNKGKNVWRIRTDNLYSGVFILTIEIEGEIYRKKFVVSKK